MIRTASGGTGRRSSRARISCGSVCVATIPGRTNGRPPSRPCISDAADAGRTDWGRIRTLYDRLLAAAGSAVVAVNRAVAVLETDGPVAALHALDDLAASPAGPRMAAHQHSHATRAEALTRLGRVDEAREAYDRALELTGDRRAAVTGRPPS